ncbi:sialate O-acetylesterase [Rufibacter glacialis]|uniref:Sialate O-acetylesterase n=1 Tax=Rufibacter glacialis TaxID=1259555 RepID=A0A5M8QAZ9_9BACT|nr:sialate O-acetylesterase [Rufibacter glacialis]KAA6431702.1 sialate O-acetylesterase [Rufibacter glacialis]
MAFLRTLVFLLLVLLSFPGLTQVRLPRLVSNGMVLQRDQELKIWGWAGKKEKVAVSFRGKNYQTQADTAGNWQVKLPAMKAGGPFPMTIKGFNTITLQDILVGDVWVCSGQSNMETTLTRVRPLYEAEIAAAHHPQIRFYVVPQKYDFQAPRKDLEGGSWTAVTPTSVLPFSAVAYFFAKELQAKYQVPMGLILSAVGGSPAEAWVSEKTIKAFPAHFQETQRFKDHALIDQIEKTGAEQSKAWHTQLRQKDAGYQQPNLPWYSPLVSTTDWATMKVPGYWSDQPMGPVTGVVWFRKDLEVPAAMVGKPAKLLLGTIVDADSVFLNGIFVGTTSYQFPPRRYDVHAPVLKEGKNTLTVRIISNGGQGGFVEDKPYSLSAGGHTIDLKGDWQYKLGASMTPMAGQPTVRFKPVGLYNGMIAPLQNYPIKGVIWFQGESNTDRAAEYRQLFPALIQDWRSNWGQGDFPFLFVQLANFMKAQPQPSQSNWALLREAQAKALALPNIGMAVAIDIGEWNDIHPLNKKDVGHRLALAAQKVAYGDKKVVSSGPTFQSMTKDGQKIILTFTNTGSGLVTKGGPLRHFAIAGPDKKFVWAKAEIKGNTVTVWSEAVPSPEAVRYAWADNPEGANLYNQEGLPAAPFRTDVD